MRIILLFLLISFTGCNQKNLNVKNQLSNKQKNDSTCIQTNEIIDGMKVYSYVEKMPEFKGGQDKLMDYLRENVKYPAIDSSDLQFKIFAIFIIDTVGKIRNLSILRPLYKDKLTPLEAEILRVIKNMPDWTPAKHNGIKVPVRLNIPINIDYK